MAEARAKIEQVTGQKLPESTIYHMIKEGRVQAVRLGYRISIPPASLADFLTAALCGDEL